MIRPLIFPRLLLLYFLHTSHCPLVDVHLVSYKVTQFAEFTLSHSQAYSIEQKVEGPVHFTNLARHLRRQAPETGEDGPRLRFWPKLHLFYWPHQRRPVYISLLRWLTDPDWLTLTDWMQKRPYASRLRVRHIITKWLAYQINPN